MLLNSQSAPQTWLGLLLDRVGQQAEANVLREILGPAALLTRIDLDGSPFVAARRMAKTKATAVVAVAHDDTCPKLATVLRIACSLAGLRCIVVLHDAVDAGPLLALPGVILLRDSALVRESLHDAIGRSAMATHTVSTGTGSTGTWATSGRAYRIAMRPAPRIPTGSP